MFLFHVLKIQMHTGVPGLKGLYGLHGLKGQKGLQGPPGIFKPFQSKIIVSFPFLYKY